MICLFSAITYAPYRSWGLQRVKTTQSPSRGCCLICRCASSSGAVVGARRQPRLPTDGVCNSCQTGTPMTAVLRIRTQHDTASTRSFACVQLKSIA